VCKAAWSVEDIATGSNYWGKDSIKKLHDANIGITLAFGGAAGAFKDLSVGCTTVDSE